MFYNIRNKRINYLKKYIPLYTYRTSTLKNTYRQTLNIKTYKTTITFFFILKLLFTKRKNSQN